MTNRENDIECVVNLYKDVYGVKPRGATFQKLLQSSDMVISEYIKDLSAESKRIAEAETNREKVAFQQLENFLNDMQEDYSIDRATAIKWEMEAHDCDDIEYWLYIWGIGFSDMSHFKKQFEDV
jgi:hypothetical protein